MYMKFNFEFLRHAVLVGVVCGGCFTINAGAGESSDLKKKKSLSDMSMSNPMPYEEAPPKTRRVASLGDKKELEQEIILLDSENDILWNLRNQHVEYINKQNIIIEQQQKKLNIANQEKENFNKRIDNLKKQIELSKKSELVLKAQLNKDPQYEAVSSKEFADADSDQIKRQNEIITQKEAQLNAAETVKKGLEHQVAILTQQIERNKKDSSERKAKHSTRESIAEPVSMPNCRPNSFDQSGFNGGTAPKPRASSISLKSAVFTAIGGASLFAFFKQNSASLLEKISVKNFMIGNYVNGFGSNIFGSSGFFFHSGAALSRAAAAASAMTVSVADSASLKLFSHTAARTALYDSDFMMKLGLGMGVVTGCLGTAWCMKNKSSFGMQKNPQQENLQQSSQSGHGSQSPSSLPSVTDEAQKSSVNGDSIIQSKSSPVAFSETLDGHLSAQQEPGVDSIAEKRLKAEVERLKAEVEELTVKNRKSADNIEQIKQRAIDEITAQKNIVIQLGEKLRLLEEKSGSQSDANDDDPVSFSNTQESEEQRLLRLRLKCQRASTRDKIALKNSSTAGADALVEELLSENSELNARLKHLSGQLMEAVPLINELKQMAQGC